VTRQGKILIADDDHLFLRTTAAVLEKAGYACECAENVPAAIELTAREQIDLLLADINMPGNTQLELIQSLPAESFRIPVILVTGQPSLHTAVEAVRLQIVSYLIKPFEVSQLLEEVRRALAHADTQRRLLTLQSRWRAWGEDLLDNAAVLQPQEAISSNQALEMMLNMSLHNLSRSLADIQDLRFAICNSAQSLASPPPVTQAASETPLSRASLIEARKVRTHSPISQIEPTQLPAELRAELQQLSPREREVLRLLLVNHKPQTIAKRLFISLHTVRNHIRSIFEKFEVHSQIELLTRLGRHVPYADLQKAV
jgi:DNA-binding NarL/FixJ family response regulator